MTTDAPASPRQRFASAAQSRAVRGGSPAPLGQKSDQNCAMMPRTPPNHAQCRAVRCPPQSRQLVPGDVLHGRCCRAACPARPPGRSRRIALRVFRRAARGSRRQQHAPLDSVDRRQDVEAIGSASGTHGIVVRVRIASGRIVGSAAPPNRWRKASISRAARRFGNSTSCRPARTDHPAPAPRLASASVSRNGGTQAQRNAARGRQPGFGQPSGSALGSARRPRRASACMRLRSPHASSNRRAAP